MSGSECNEGGSGPERKGPADDPSVQGTVVPILAEFEQWLIDQKAGAERWFARLYEETDKEGLAITISEAIDNALDELSSVQGGRNSRQPERTLLPTAVDQIAKWLAEDEAEIERYDTGWLSFQNEVYLNELRNRQRRLRAIMESINAGKV